MLWAPIVDSLYIRRFGRRKSWLVPVQYCIGITMLLLAQNVDYYLDSTPPDVFSLTCMFFFLNFLAATQDIAGKYFIFTILLVLLELLTLMIFWYTYWLHDFFFQSTVGLWQCSNVKMLVMLQHVIQLDKPLVSYEYNIPYIYLGFFFIFIKFFRLFSWLCLLHSIRELWSVDSERFFELLGCDIPYCYELSSYFQARKWPTIHTWHGESNFEIRSVDGRN